MDEVLFGRAVDAALDAHGKLQAQQLAGHFAGMPALRLESSPRRRARETATAIALRRQCAVRLAPAMDEVDFGRWAGRSFAQLADDPTWQRWNEARGDARTPAGEDMNAVQARAVRYLSGLQNACASSIVVIVTHAELIRAVLLHWQGAPLEDYWRLEISPASLTTLAVHGTEVKIEGVNERIAP
jgi:broad specificity phosphatase PhoE